MRNILKNTFLVLLTLMLVAHLCMVVAIAPADHSVGSEQADLEPIVPNVTEQVVEATIATVSRTLLAEPVIFDKIVYKVFYDTDLSNEYIAEIEACEHELIEEIASDNYTEEAEQLMQEELTRIRDIAQRVAHDRTVYATWEQEHYYAAKTYKYLRQNGYSAAVACGIIGNMMIETSGGTLDINPDIYSYDRSFYGLWQWSLYYYPDVADISFEEQLLFLQNTIVCEFTNFGFCYETDFTYEDFMALEDPEQASIAFAKVYESCG
jgi:hypothetical protein